MFRVHPCLDGGRRKYLRLIERQRYAPSLDANVFPASSASVLRVALLLLSSQIGELFPGPSKTTRAYLHTEEAVRKALADEGFTVKRTEMTSTNFYYSRMLEAVRE